MTKIRATVGFLTYQSEEHLARALESVKDFEEILVADGGSTDSTMAIAERFNARVIRQSNPGHPIEDFSLERNRLLDAATQPWFIYIDSDEIMSPELSEKVRAVAEDRDHAYGAYQVRYLKTNETGERPYRTYREYYQVRLVRTDIGARFVRAVHERIQVPEGVLVGRTDAPWYVPLDSGDLALVPFVLKAWKRTGLTAGEWYPRGVKDAFRKTFVEPATYFAKAMVRAVGTRVKWGRDAIPLRYELFRALYALMLFVRHAARIVSVAFHGRGTGTHL